MNLMARSKKGKSGKDDPFAGDNQVAGSTAELN